MTYAFRKQVDDPDFISIKGQALTGGTLLLRNKFFIVIYRGKDFLPRSVASAVLERQELTKKIQDAEETARIGSYVASSSYEAKDEAEDAPAGTLAEFYEAQARWGREISAEEREKMIEEASTAKSVKEVKRVEHKLALAQSKKLRAETLLAKIEASMVPVGPSDDLETITDEERFTFRRIGLSMKAYLPLGVRGIFDGVIENMHLHWKHRELVKLITKQKTLAFVEETARLLEYESGGILVAIERVPKGYAIIYYRGKNYQRPVSLRPRNLLTKAKAFKRAIAMQRHEALSQHIAELESNIDQMKNTGDSKSVEDGKASSFNVEFGSDSEISQVRHFYISALSNLVYLLT
uniref:CRM domain-containing protein n=1 Tax=Chenopodium quinoa TaxID=63459 RepID=A0A803MIC0_CHEQI